MTLPNPFKSLSRRLESAFEKADAFEDDVALQQSRKWSRLTVWGIVAASSSFVLWASFARLDEVIQVQGKLEPTAAVKDIQAPVGGVLEKLEVKEGDRVVKGQILARFDTLSARNKLAALQEIRSRLEAENSVYRAQLGEGIGQALDTNQRLRLQAASAEYQSRMDAASLQITQQQQELAKAQAQLGQLEYSLQLNQRILTDLRPLYQQGGIARTQFLKQEETVSQLTAQRKQAQSDINRLSAAIREAREKLVNTRTLTAADLRARIEENEKKLSEVDSQITDARQTVRYQRITAPVAGRVFDVKAQGTGFVANSTEPLLKLVPEDKLIARVFITNRDIGFAHVGAPADIRIDSFPFSEFGDIKGKLTKLGSDALPPNEVYKYYRFPADISLDSQVLTSQGRRYSLQSGMSVSANIRLRERPVISLLVDKFVLNLDALKGIR